MSESLRRSLAGTPEKLEKEGKLTQTRFSGPTNTTRMATFPKTDPLPSSSRGKNR